MSGTSGPNPRRASRYAEPRAPSVEAQPGVLAWVGVGLLTLSGMLAALLESLFIPVYAGTTPIPVAVVLALVSNVALPRLAGILVPRALALLLPFLGWVVVVLTFLLVIRPEGDVILPGGGLQYVTYGVLLVGALAGTITLVVCTPQPRRPERPAPGGSAG